MKAAELKVVKEAKRTAHGQFTRYYSVMGAFRNEQVSTVSQKGDVKKSEPRALNKK